MTYSQVVPHARTLRDWLREPEPVVDWRIEGWQPAQSRVILSAQFKAGKSTACGNLVRSLVDGDPWLGAYSVTPVVGAVAILDTEMSRVQLRSWMRDQGIANDDRVIVVPLRGAVRAFNLLDDEVLKGWATWMRDRQVAYVVLDCLRPVLDALGLNEDTDAGTFLVAFDRLLARAKVDEALIIHHMGHGGERSRGSSRFRDWPDAEWRIVRQREDPASPRMITAYGRDVDVPSLRLQYDNTTRRLTTVTTQMSSVAKVDETLSVVIAALDNSTDPLTKRDIIRRCIGESHPRAAILTAITMGTESGRITTARGPRGAIFHRSRTAPALRTAPPVLRSAPVGECSSAPPLLGCGALEHSAQSTPCWENDDERF